MAYDKDKLYKQAIEIIESDKYIHFIEDVVAEMPCDKTTFYRYFPVTCNEYNHIKNKIDINRNATKVEIRKELRKGRGAELIALYKLLASENELMALNSQYNKISGDVKIDYTNMSTEELIKRAEALDKLDES